MSDSLLLAPVLLPLAAAVLVFLLPRGLKWVRESLALLAACLSFAASLWIFLRGAPEVRIALLAVGAFDLRLDLVAGPLSSFILLFATGFGALVVLYSFAFMAGKARLGEYYGFLLFALAGAAGVLLSDHLLMLLIFWEMVTASLYFLITTGSPESKAGATKTFATLGLGDGCLLLGIGLLWYLSRSFTLSVQRLPVNGWLPAAAFLLLMVGAITKAGAMPFHSWIPAASESAPAPVMALLPAAVDKLLGIYLLALLVTRVFVLTAGLGLVLMIVGAVTLLAAVMVAMVQHDLRRLLSYHAVSQVGYMLLGIGTLTPVGIAGGLFHMLNNAIYKSCLFLCAGAVERRTGSTDLAELGGLARAMPLTFLTCLVSALAISGVPPLNGFVSKWLVYQGVIETGAGWSFIFLVAAMFGSALTLASFIKVVYSVFLGAPSQAAAPVKREVGFGMLLPMALLSALSLLFGVYYLLPLSAFIAPGLGVRLVFPGVWSSSLATGLIVAGLVVGLIVYLLGRYRKSARVVSAFTGGEELDAETGRLLGTHFYDTIRSMPLLRGAYAAQERGSLDPYGWIGGLGLAVTGLLRRVHNGLLSWYLAWSLLGMAALLLLFILVR